MLSISFLFAVAVFALLLLFFAFLPDLRSCALASPDAPQLTKPTAEKQKTALPGLLLIMAVYTAAAFWNLGNTSSPESFAPMEGRSVILEFREPETPATAVLFPGVGTGEYSIEVSNDQEGWHPVASFSQDHVSVLKWQYIELMQMGSFRFLRIHCTEGRPWLGEIGILDSEGQTIPFLSSVPELGDEGPVIPASSNYMNSSYFDEIYHARTAWEHLHAIWPYEISHPPLGKEILSLGILLFGMTPFGWRFSGTLMGILMLPVMYCFLRRMFGGTRIPTLGTILLASGFMHYAQTRIATIDSYAVLFIMLMFWFMYAWLSSGKIRDLALCGLAFGFGAACKWTCLYAGAGLGFIWLVHWVLCIVKNGLRDQEKCGVLCSVVRADPGPHLLSFLYPVRACGGENPVQQRLYKTRAGQSELYAELSCIRQGGASLCIEVVSVDPECPANPVLSGILPGWEAHQHCRLCKPHYLLGRSSQSAGPCCDSCASA